MKTYIFLFVAAFTQGGLISIADAQKSIAERLGYDKNAKLLIIHADDLGDAHSQNVASIKAMENGVVSSASIMMPTPWVSEIIHYALAQKSQPDFGLHLTLTSEWKYYKWGPVASVDPSTGLVGPNGYFYDNCETLKNVPLEVIRAELEAQIAMAYKMGLKPTHFDSHMRCLFDIRPEVFGLYIEMGRKYHVPVMLSQEFLTAQPECAKYVHPEDLVPTSVMSASPEDFKKGMPQYYENMFENLKPGGFYVVAIHTAFDDVEMQSICVDHPDWGSAWRQADYDFFTSKDAAKLLKQNDIQVITWGDIGKLMAKK